MTNLLIYGSVALDTVQTSNHVAPDVLGGSASYAAVAAAMFGSAGMIGIVGDDFPAEFSELLSDRGVDLTGLERAEGSTFSWTGRYHDNMNKRDTLETSLGVMGENYRPNVPDAYKSCEYVLLANMDPDSQSVVLDQMNKPKYVIADTMDLWINTMRRSLDKLLLDVDMLILNESEALQLTGSRSLFSAGKFIQNLGPKHVIIKKGENGALLFYGDHLGSIPAEPLMNLADPTGAGDTFAGALVGYLASQDQYDEDAIRLGMVYGAIMAAATCSAFTLDGLVALDTEQLEDRLDAFKRLIKI